MPQGQTAAGGEEAGARGAAGGALSLDMHRGGFPTLDLPISSWSEPPRDVLDCILEKLEEHRDILRFSCICAAWRSFTLENLQRFPRQLPLARCLPQQCQLPLLMLPSKDTAKSSDFFCVFEHKFYGGRPLPDSNKWIWGSSNGWLVTVDISGSEIYLFNPITTNQIYLPAKTEIPRPKCDRNQVGLQTFYYHTKAVLSKSPASNMEDYVVMAIISTTCVLSYCRPGDCEWTNVADSPMHVDDIIYYKEQFYAVTQYGVVLACNIGPSPKATALVGRPKVYVDDEISDHLIYMKRYLVESRGELIQIVRMVVVYGDGDMVRAHRTVDFQVFKLQEKGLEDDEVEAAEELQEKGSEDDEVEAAEEYKSIDGVAVPVEDSNYKWVKLDNLPDQIIFLGFNQSFSLPAAALPNSRGSCIYFTDDYMDYYYGRIFEDNPEYPTDMGVFNMEDGSVHPFPLVGLVFPIPPIWVSPEP